MPDASEATLSATGMSYPPTVKPIERRPGGSITWHDADCPAPEGRCKLHPLKTGCAAAPDITPIPFAEFVS